MGSSHWNWLGSHLEFQFTGRQKTNLKASTETRTFSTQKNHEKKTNFFYPTHCKTITSLVSSLDCMSLPMMPSYLMLVDAIIRSTIVDVFNFISKVFFSYTGCYGKLQNFQFFCHRQIFALLVTLWQTQRTYQEKNWIF